MPFSSFPPFDPRGQCPLRIVDDLARRTTTPLHRRARNPCRYPRVGIPRDGRRRIVDRPFHDRDARSEGFAGWKQGRSFEFAPPAAITEGVQLPTSERRAFQYLSKQKKWIESVFPAEIRSGLTSASTKGGKTLVGSPHQDAEIKVGGAIVRKACLLTNAPPARSQRRHPVVPS